MLTWPPGVAKTKKVVAIAQKPVIYIEARATPLRGYFRLPAVRDLRSEEEISMQKKVFAAVVGGLLATPAVFADSANVTISGRFAIGFESYKTSRGNPPNAAGYSNENRVSDQSSSIIFSGAEDLGGGLKAWFQIDERYSPDGSAATSLGATGNTQAGLSGGFGKLAIGRQDLHYQEISRL